MSNRRQLWLLAGGSGAGKRTFHRLRLAPLGLPLLNADLIARSLSPNAPQQRSHEAARVAVELGQHLLEEGRTFAFRTCFSEPSEIDFIALAKTLGYEILLVFIHLQSLGLHQARIAQDARENGQSAAPDGASTEIPQLLEHLKTALPLCDQVRILDNSRCDDPFRQIGVIRAGQVEIQTETALPDWTALLVDLEGGQA